MLQPYPDLDAHDLAVVAEIGAMRTELAAYLQVSRPWTARMLRTARAAAVRGSVMLAGYQVALDDADAALDDLGPLTPERPDDAPPHARSVDAAVRGYRRAHAFALAAAADGVPLDATALRALHHMLLADAAARPGRLRTGPAPIGTVPTVPTVPAVPAPPGAPADQLGEALAEALAGAFPNAAHPDADAVVRAAMVHLRLVTLRPFDDGNGRLARLAQAWVLAADGVPEPEADGVVEWLGDHPDEYRRALVAGGAGAWPPGGDAHPWVVLVLRAHHLHAQALRGRWYRAAQAYADLDGVVAEHRLPARVVDPLYTVLLGFRLRRATYVATTGTDLRTASRDVKAMTDVGLLVAVGETKGRHYVRGSGLDDAAARLARPTPVRDPYAWG